jgi:hypothetical protein
MRSRQNDSFLGGGSTVFESFLGQLLRALLGGAILLACGGAIAQSASPGQAIVADSSDAGGQMGGTFFVLTAVGGNEVVETALTASRRASAGRGAYMLIQGAERPVPAGPVSLTLHALHAHAAPMATFVRSVFRDGTPEVRGTVQVELLPGHRYKVRGAIDALRREVWLEDERGAEVSGSRVTAQLPAELLKQMEGAVFLKSNLRYEDDWINEGMSPSLPIVPVGSRLKVVDVGSNKASVLIDGRKMRIGLDWTRGMESVSQFIARVTGTGDPRLVLATWPERTQAAVRSGRVLLGMSRDQVLMSLGPPRLDHTPRLDEREWKYEVPEQEELFLMFDDAGLLKGVDGSRKARGLVIYDGP